MDQRYQRVSVLICQHRYDDAESQLRLILAGSPSESRGHAMLAMVMSRNESRLNGAKEEAVQAISHGPDESLGHYALALVEFGRKQYRAAGEAIDEAIRLDPMDAANWAMRARCDFALQKFPDMLVAVNRGLEIDPENIECRNLLSLALERTGNVSSSLDQASQTLRMDPDDDQSHAMMGFALLQNGKHIEARQAFREALRINPMNEYAREGMMDAIASRSIVFRTVSRFYSWLNRMTGQRQMMILLGGWLLVNLLNRLAKTNEIADMISLPLMLAYAAFAVMTWIATPLFQTFLRFHPFGKHLLRSREIWLSNFVAPCLSLAIVGGIYGTFSNDAYIGINIAIYWVVATMVAVCCFRAPTFRGTATYAVYAMSAAILLLPFWGIAESIQATSYAPLAYWSQIAIWTFVGLQIFQMVASNRSS